MDDIWGEQDGLIIHLESEAAINTDAEVLDLEDNLIACFRKMEQAKDYVTYSAEHEGHVSNWEKR